MVQTRLDPHQRGYSVPERSRAIPTRRTFVLNTRYGARMGVFNNFNGTAGMLAPGIELRTAAAWQHER